MELPGEKLIIKLIETVEKCAGGLLAPWQMRRVGQAQAASRRFEMLLMAQTEGDIDAIKSGEKLVLADGTLFSRSDLRLSAGQNLNDDLGYVSPEVQAPPNVSELVGAADSAERQRTVRRGINLMEIVAKAHEEASSNTHEEVSDDQVDPDWFARWRAGAEDVSTDTLQQLWARILAGEVKQPGSYSIHTLDFLRRMSQSDAELVERIARFTLVSGGSASIYLKTPELLEAAGVTSEALLELADLGLVAGITSGGMNLTLHGTERDEFQDVVVCREKALLIRGPDPKSRIDLPVYRVTRVGRELLTLCKFASADLDYLRKIGDVLKARGYSAQIGDWKAFRPGKYRIENVSTL